MEIHYFGCGQLSFFWKMLLALDTSCFCITRYEGELPFKPPEDSVVREGAKCCDDIFFPLCVLLRTKSICLYVSYRHTYYLYRDARCVVTCTKSGRGQFELKVSLPRARSRKHRVKSSTKEHIPMSNDRTIWTKVKSLTCNNLVSIIINGKIRNFPYFDFGQNKVTMLFRTIDGLLFGWI